MRVVNTLSLTGVVLAYAGSAAPSGFLLCDGSAVSRTAYAGLFAVIGSSHGQGDGSTTFNLPDYRGRFLRGVDGGVARDPNRAARTAMNAGGNTGDAVGSVQADAFQGHVHTIGTNLTGGGGSDRPSMASETNFNSTSPVSDGTNGTPRTSSETRPINASVNYIIKT